MSEHKPEKKAEKAVSGAGKAKAGERKVDKGELSEKELDKASGGEHISLNYE